MDIFTIESAARHKGVIETLAEEEEVRVPGHSGLHDERRGPGLGGACRENKFLY